MCAVLRRVYVFISDRKEIVNVYTYYNYFTPLLSILTLNASDLLTICTLFPYILNISTL